ncbi:MAG: FtsX-like permease family protein [Pseudomonadota bacterium]
MAIFVRESRFLGVSRGRQKYDLPLNKDKGNLFLIILMGLMTFLMVLTLVASFVLTAMNERWSTGIEGKASVEISALDQNGAASTQEDVDNFTAQSLEFLNNHPAISSAEQMEKNEIIKLVSPWLGNDITLDNVPLPGIISVEFRQDVIVDRDSINDELKKISPQIRLDTHETWLKDVLRFTGSIKFAALLMTAIITITTIVSVAGAIQSRMAVYNEELELLHLMGASDGYISRQLQKYAFITVFKGAAIGMVIGWLCLLLIRVFVGSMEISLVPEFSMSWEQVLFLVFLPVTIALIAMATARQTVLRFLRRMP